MNVYKNFFFSYLLIFFSVIFFLVFVIFFSKNKGFGYKNEYLINYQIEKIKKIDSDTRIIFLGDSSLGYSISANEWTNISRKKTLNLALTGDYQFSGTRDFFNMINKKNIEEIYIVASIDSWRIQDAEENLADYSIFFKKNFSIIKNNLNLHHFLNILRFFLSPEMDRPFNIKKVQIDSNYDYIIPNDNFDKIYPSKFIPFQTNQIIKTKINYLNQIFEKCNLYKISCVYLHGPLLDEICRQVETKIFINQLNKILIENKIKHSDKIICVPRNHIGDGYSHVSSNFKSYYTNQYYKLIYTNSFGS